MATAGKDTQSKELNALFRSLGELDEEGKQRREQNHLFSESMQFFNTLWFPTTFRLYGSEAEDLKCYFPDDVGDMDIMIFQDSDNCIIDEEILEYLPENPLHVRIKAADHPLFKSCLVEDTGYVATSALKNFDRAIFSTSNASRFITVWKMISTLMNPQICRVFMTNDIISPAITLHMASSFGSLSEMLEAYKGSTDPLPNFDPAACELFAIIVCIIFEIDYTRELADRLNDFWQLCKTSLCSLAYSSTNTIWQDTIGSTGDLFMELITIFLEEIYGERWLAIIVCKIFEVDYTRELADRLNDFWQLCKTSLCSLVYTSTNTTWQDTIGLTGDLLMELMTILEEIYGERWWQEQFESNAPERERAERNSAWEVLPFHNDILQSDAELAPASSTGVEDPLEDTMLLGGFGPVPEMQEEPSKRKKFRDMEEAKPYVQVGGIDFIPALKARGWPNVAKEWIKRERKWPSHEVVKKVIREGFHLVVKPPKNSGNPECDFRLSFSHAEYLLSQEMNYIQRECYRYLKKSHHTHLSTQPMSLTSFHLKTILLHTIEETDPKIWTESNRAECMMKLLLNLMEAIRKKHLPHFFVKSYNLFSPDCMENSELLETLIAKVEQIVERPEEFANKLIKDEKDAKQSRKGWCPACQGNLIGSELTVSAKESERQLEEIETTQSESNIGIQAQHDELQGSTNTSPSYYELKDIYVDIYRELINLALSDNVVEGLGDLERKLVETLRECAEKYKIDDEQTFSRLFEIGWKKIYITIWLNNEGLNIERMLVMIQGLVELWREPNEEADGTPDPFDLEALLTSGIFKTLLSRMIRCIVPGQLN